MTVNTSAAPAGWHPDPSNPSGALRWWDGTAWTTHTHQVIPTPPPVFASPQPMAAGPQPMAWSTAPVTAASAAWPGGSATITPNHGAASYGSGLRAPANLSFAHRNSISLTAIGVVVLYVLLAMTTHFVLIGILPILMSVRAIKAKETLAPAAVGAAIVAVLVAFAALQ